jgi:hypothetical protein
MVWEVALYEVKRMAFRKPRPNKGGSSPVNKEVV